LPVRLLLTRSNLGFVKKVIPHVQRKLLLTAGFIIFVFNATAIAHPGKTASDGCHYCRTNCDRWGVEWNDRHCHKVPAPPTEPPASNNPAKEVVSDVQTYVVSRAIDGDTLLLSNGERIRLIGVNTPETVHPNKPVEYFGKEASAFTKREIEGRKVRLEYDWQKQDRYGRTLGYVYRIPDDFFLNAEIIKQGYGHAYTPFPFKYLDQFRQYEREARENKKGLWG
jgi:micrococcal nuclease